MSYADKTKIRLAKYKSDQFPELQDGIWKGNNVPYPHILPEENKFCNLLSTYKDKLETYLLEQKIKLHPDFHHLNSSQAMCFNFFFPLYYERKLELITDFLGLNDEKVNYDTFCFEKDGKEAQFGRVPTSFDFYFETISGKKLHFEIKYTEDKFGKGRINPDKFKNVYSKFLKPLKSSFHSSQPFFENYQILRNLIHIDDNCFVVFVYPRDNHGISREADRVKTDFLISNYNDYFFAVTWEKILDIVSTLTANENIKSQLGDFRKKYLT